MPPHVFRTDEQIEAVFTLESVVEAASRIGQNPYNWKWAILALHSGLQGLMVLALRGGNGLRALPDKLAEEWLQAYRAGTKPPVERLDRFPNLYVKIKSSAMKFFVHSQLFVPAGSEDASMRRLNSLRNEFAHFLPKTWLIDLSGMPRICLDCLSVGEFLSEKSGNISWRKVGHHSRVRRAFRKARIAFRALEDSYS